jgi:hypothetical protein
MTRIIQLTAFALAVAVLGCGSSEQPKPSAPIVTQEKTNKKGAKTKAMEATFQDPAARK